MDIAFALLTSELLIGCVACIIGLLIFYSCLPSKKTSIRLPPRPFSLPFIGPIEGSMFSFQNSYSIFFFVYATGPLWTIDSRERQRQWIRWARRLQSDIVSIRFFPLPFPIVMLNSYESIRDAFCGPETADAISGRPRSKLREIVNPGYFGVT